MKKAAHMTMLLMATPRLTLAFSSSMKRHVATLLQAASAKVEPLAAPIIDASNNELLLKSFNPLGTPEELSGLSLGQTMHLQDKDITRLSSSPDIFLIKDLIPKDDRTTLIQAAESQGIMKIAGTRQSGENTIRKNSFISWIDPYTLSSYNKDEGDIENDDWRDAPAVARETILKSRLCFAHSVMNDIINNVDNIAVCSAEDLQIAKYNNGGSYDYHHDGYGRYLTCLCYLNGIGGTYFPFANMSKNELDGIDFTNENEVSVLSLKKQFDKCGILIVGEEGQDAYLQSSLVKPKTVIQIDAGDAIAFYNYTPSGEKDLRQLHCSLPVPQEKWIATSWLRSDALTGPFALMKKAQLFESWRGC